MTPIFKAAQVSIEGEESKYTFMRLIIKTLRQHHITTSNMPTPPTSETFVSVKRHADQKIHKTRKKRRIEKVRNLSSIQKEQGDGSPENMEDHEAHSPPALKLFQQVAELARKAVQNAADENEEHLKKEDEVVEEEIVQRWGCHSNGWWWDTSSCCTEEDSQKIDSVDYASLQKKDENVAETAEEEHQKVDTPQNVEENPPDQDQRVEENTELAAQKFVEVTDQ